MLEDAWQMYGRALYGFALALVGRPEDAEDVLQGVFLGLVKARARLAEVRDLKGYLYASTRHAAHRLLRSRREESPLEEVTLVVAPPQEARRAALDVSRALAALPLEQREVVVLKLYHSMTFQEIAATTGVSPNTAASRYRYALGKLRQALEPGEEAARG